MHAVYMSSLLVAVLLAAATTVASCGVRLGRGRRLRRRAEAVAYGGGDPAVLLLLGCTAFGALGLLAERLLPGWSPRVLAAIVAGLALLLAGSLAAAIRAYFRPVAQLVPFEGAQLLGARGHVSVAIPADGVGAVAYLACGKRIVRPARAADGRALALRSPVRIVAVQRGTVVVTALSSTAVESLGDIRD